MRTRYKKKCLMVLPPGLILLAACAGILIFAPDYQILLPFLGIPGFFLYLWGLSLLAKAKGLSQGIILTVVVGIISPLAILMLLEDKERKF